MTLIELLNSLSSRFGAMLLQLTLRSSLVIAAAAVLVLVFRSQPAALKHFICRAALSALLLLPAIQLATPPLRTAAPILWRSSPRIPVLPGNGKDQPIASPQITPAVPERPFPWMPIAAGAYLIVAAALLARLWLGVRRISAIIRRAVPITDSQLHELTQEIWLQIPKGATRRHTENRNTPILVSPDISVPLAIGVIDVSILLPASWRLWPPDKLRAVLLHELAHLCRRDPLTAFLASVALCVFWMHPLLYWLRRQLTALSEQACDEVVIQSLDRERYCRILIEFATDMTAAHGRLAFASSAVAHKSGIKARLERILSFSSPHTSNGTLLKTLLLAAFLPALYLAASTRFDHANAPAPPAHFISIKNAKQAAEWESVLRQDPENLIVRSALLAFYSNMRDERNFTKHKLWVIQHHPEAPFAGGHFYGKPTPKPSTTESYKLLKAAWEQALKLHSDSAEVLYNAGRCLEEDDPLRAIALFKKARSLTPPEAQSQEWYLDAMATVYAAAVIADVGHKDPRVNNMVMTPPVAAPLRREVETSADPAFLSKVGTAVVELTGASEGLVGLAFIQRAIQLDPANPKWQEALDEARVEPIRRRNLREIVKNIKRAEPLSQPTAADPIVLEDVQFSGKHKVSQDALDGLIFTKKGDVYTDEAAHRDFVSLSNSGLFSDVRIEKEKGSNGGVLLRFVVKERL